MHVNCIRYKEWTYNGELNFVSTGQLTNAYALNLDNFERKGGDELVNTGINGFQAVFDQNKIDFEYQPKVNDRYTINDVFKHVSNLQTEDTIQKDNIDTRFKNANFSDPATMGSDLLHDYVDNLGLSLLYQENTTRQDKVTWDCTLVLQPLDSLPPDIKNAKSFYITRKLLERNNLIGNFKFKRSKEVDLIDIIQKNAAALPEGRQHPMYKDPNDERWKLYVVVNDDRKDDDDDEQPTGPTG